MANKIFVGGLPWATTSDDLQQLFAQYGNITSATVITDKMTGRSRGFGFVEFADEAAAQAAIEGQNGKEFGGRTLMVKEAMPMKDRPQRSFGGGGRGGHGGGYDRGGGRRNDQY